MLENQVFGRPGGAPLISVIVPVYKVEKYIHRCVESILKQTYKNLEIIMVDDGSPDNSGKICDEYAMMDSRIKVIHQENQGLSAARNAGLDVCTGDYIAFIDSDDYIKWDYLETLLLQMEDADYVACGFLRVDSEEHISYEYIPTKKVCMSGKEVLLNHYNGENHSIKINCVYVWGRLYRKEVWTELRFPQGVLFEDIFIMPYVLLNIKKAMFIPYGGYYYCEAYNSITNRTDTSHLRKLFEDSFKIWDNHIRLYEKKSLNNLCVEVECLKIEKIITHTMYDSIPTELQDWGKTTAKAITKKLLRKNLPWKQKARYILFSLLGKKVYKLVKYSLSKEKSEV